MLSLISRRECEKAYNVSMCFLDGGSYSVGKMAKDCLLKEGVSRFRGGGKMAWDEVCEAMDNTTFPNLATIARFPSKIIRLVSRMHLEWLLSLIDLAKVEHLVIRNFVLILI
jgi:hypothetical protein